MPRINSFIAEVLASPGKRWVRHLLLQALLLMISSSVLWEAATDYPDATAFSVWIAYFAVLNLLVYANIYLAKRFLINEDSSVYLLSAAGLVAVFIFLIGVMQTFLPEENGQGSAPAWIGVISSVAAVGLLFAGTSALVLFRRLVIAGRRRRELESLNLSTELQMLKNQINPHFLFNMLNNCYLLVKKGRPEAAEVLLRLEELLRYQIKGADNEKVSLREEAGFLNDLLSLEKIRRDNFRYNLENNVREDTKLPPMLFIPFVENAIKHNSDSENLSYVDIKFESWEKGLIFSCVNSKPVMVPDRETGGLGLKNIRRRLELLLPQRHELQVIETEREYRVMLKLQL